MRISPSSLLLAILFAHPAVAQAVYGNVYGTTTDQSGALIAGAKITILDVAKGTLVQTVSNASGNYTVTHLAPGDYNVRGEAPGFKSKTVLQVEVFADQGARVDLQFEVGVPTESVTVSAEELPLLKTDRADVATTFTDREVVELPLFDRNFTELQIATPGAKRLDWQHASSENPQGSIQIVINGQHFGGTSFVLDGTDNRDPILGIIVINPTLESVSETKIITSNFDAEFGQAAGAVISTTTKSGTNALHGSGFAFRRTNFLRARNPFTQPPDQHLPDTQWNQLGGSLGGPIRRNSIFFFGDYQATRRSLGGSQLINVPAFPSLQARQECLAGAQCDLSLYPVPIFDPATGNPDGSARQPFAGNVIPGARLSKQALNLLALLPSANAGAGGDVVNNYIGSGSEQFDDDAFNVRLDNYVREAFTVFGRYSFADFRKSAPAIFGDIAGGTGLAEAGVSNSFAGSSLARNQSLALGFAKGFGPNWLADFRFGWFRYRVAVKSRGAGIFPAADADIPGLNLGDELTSGMPAFLILGLGELRFGNGLAVNSCACPLDETEMQYQIVNNWTRVTGNHSLKFGGDVRYANNLRVASGVPRNGILIFLPTRTGLFGPNAGGGLALASFLLGDVSRFSRSAGSVTDAGERQRRWFFYGQDTWRVTPKLTVNYGLRWEIYEPEWVTGSRRGGFVDFTTGNIRVAGVGGIGLNMNVENSFRNFAPRLGVAYQVGPKTVVRLGAGRTFDIGVFGTAFGHVVTQNLPVLAVQQEEAPAIWERAFDLAQGPPPPDFGGPVPENGLLRLPAGIGQSLRPLKMRMPTVDSWNLSVQQAIAPGLTAELAYVGSKTIHGFVSEGPSYNCNEPTVKGFAEGVPRSQRRPFFQKFGWTQDLNCYLNDGSSSFHSLQARIEKRFSRGVQFQANYTWSKALTHGLEYFAVDPRVSYGPVDFDRAHQINVTALWELPVGRQRRFGSSAPRALDWFVGGWQLATLTTWLSGLPFTPRYLFCDFDRDTGPCRPDLVGDPRVGGGRDDWFAAATEPLVANGMTSGPWRRPLVGQFGSVGRNSLRGPGFFQADLSVMKSYVFSRSVRATVRADIFNVFNVVNLGLPDVCVDCNLGTAGKITSTASLNNTPQRQVQFAVRLEF